MGELLERPSCHRPQGLHTDLATGQGTTPAHHSQGLSSRRCLFPKSPAYAWDQGSGPKWRARGLNLQHRPRCAGAPVPS